MKRFITFGSIEGFDTVVKNVQHTVQFEGLDEDNKPIYNKSALMPKVDVIFSEKIHGTNAGVCYNNIEGLWVQSRNNIITTEKDNAGCVFFVESHKQAWVDIIENLAKFYSIDIYKNTISVFFEWAGGNIQKKSALTGVDKTAVIFQHFKVSSNEVDNDESAYWLETKGVDNKTNNIYNIINFDTYTIEVDFNQPSLSKNKMIELVEKIIEPASPVGKAFGKEANIGEGVVGTFMLNGTLQRFKIKGEAHANSKVKTLKPVDDVKEQAKIDFANYAANALRLEQMFDLANDVINGGHPDIKNIGMFIKMVNQDIIKEETHILIDKGLEPKEVFPHIAKIAKTWYVGQLLVF